jgi:hypothetical protein
MRASRQVEGACLESLIPLMILEEITEIPGGERTLCPSAL